MTFTELQHAMIEGYRAKEYQAALDLINREIDQFPEQIGHTYYWRACLLALLDRTAEALASLQAGLDLGTWFPPQFLQEDPDLASLRELPTFARIVGVCQERKEAAQARAVPLLMTVPARTGSAPHPLLMALHGNNSNAKATSGLWAPAADQGWLVAVPQSSQVVLDDGYVWDDRDSALREVQQHYQTLMAEQPIDRERTVVGGFSMGGGTAIYLALSQTIAVRGFVTLGPWLPDADVLRPLLAEGRGKGLRGAIVVGEADKECLATSRTVAALMEQHGLACQVTVLPNLAHAYPADFAQHLQQGLDFVLG